MYSYRVHCREKKFVKKTVAKAKDMDLFIPVYGKPVWLTNAVAADFNPVNIALTCKRVKKHVIYHSSLNYDWIFGIEGLDNQQIFCSASDQTSVDGSISLHHVMCHYVKLAGGSSLFAKIHQVLPMSTVHAVVPRIPEAERMVAVMNKQPAVFVKITPGSARHRRQLL